MSTELLTEKIGRLSDLVREGADKQRAELETFRRELTGLQETVTAKASQTDPLVVEMRSKMEAQVTFITERLSQIESDNTARMDRIEQLAKRADQVSATTMTNVVEFKRQVSLAGNTNAKDVAKDLTPEAYDTYRRNFFGYVRNPEQYNTVHPENRRTLQVGIGEDGGFLVPAEMATFIVEQLRDRSPIREAASVITVSSPLFSVPVENADYDAVWLAEGQPAPAQNGTFTSVDIPVRNLLARIQLTKNIRDDAAFDIEGWVQRKITDSFIRKEGQAFVTGDGVQSPTGIINTPNGTTMSTIERINTGSATGITYAQAIAIMLALRDAYHAGAAWYIRRQTLTSFLTLVDGAGKLIFNPQMISSFGQFNLFGYPIRFIDAMPPIASNARAYLFGNMEGYTIVDRMGIEMLVDPYTGYPNIRHNVMKRTGGHLTAGDRFKIGVCATL